MLHGLGKQGRETQPPLKSLRGSERLHFLLAAPEMPTGHRAKPKPVLTGSGLLAFSLGRTVPAWRLLTGLPGFLPRRGGCPGNGPGPEDLGTSRAGCGRIHRRPSRGPGNAGLGVGRDGGLRSAHPGGQAGPGVSGGRRESAEASPGGWRAARGPPGEEGAAARPAPNAAWVRTWQRGSCGSGCLSSCCSAPSPPPHLPPSLQECLQVVV